MKKVDFAQRLAEESGLSAAEAADQLDGVVYEILRKLRDGKPAALPGLGVFRPSGQPRIRFEVEAKPGNAAAAHPAQTIVRGAPKGSGTLDGKR